MLTFRISGNYTDLYEITMGEVYFLEGRDNMPACFDYFFRKIPNQGGYVLFAGLHDLDRGDRMARRELDTRGVEAGRQLGILLEHPHEGVSRRHRVQRIGVRARTRERTVDRG